MDSYEQAYSKLNDSQRKAVDCVDGPLLVLAGPGTGKTQLLGARVSNILKSTDTPPQNVLCLTFTESGAANMRERLARFIGNAAYDVTISTYHAFGGDLIKRHPQYFSDSRAQNPVDDLGKRQLLLAITESMSFSNPLKQARHHIGDLMSTISETKRALLQPDDLRAIATENLACITGMNHALSTIFAGFKIMPRKLPQAAGYFEQVLHELQSLQPENPVNSKYGSLAAIAAETLRLALLQAETDGKTTPLTAWKNKWLEKNENNDFVFSGRLENERIRSLAAVLEQYQSELAEQNLYDFDDMILRSISALEKYADLRYTLQERYLYLLLDEFQDTNAAQLRLIELLTDNPVHEGRPNVMAVGDDDQAIYAFQGAQYSNMYDFYRMYRDVKVINLTENYRSHGHILTIAQNVAQKITARLHHHFDDISKTLSAAAGELSGAEIERVEFLSNIAERDWIAGRIKTLVANGTPPSSIAVLAPKHKHLEPLVPYLNNLGIPVRYEKRENILKAPVVRQLITMGRLLIALEANDQAAANNLWPQVLSYDFWAIPTSDIWQIAWRVSDDKDNKISWSQELLSRPEFTKPAQLMLGLATRLRDEPLETVLDYLTGNTPLDTHDPALPQVTSPLRNFYTSQTIQHDQPALFYETVSHLAVLRAKLREHQQASEETLTLFDFIRFISMYEEADQQMLNTSPYSQQADAVQLMTVFKAKGLEFDHVFLPSCQDDVWGSSAAGNSNKLTLPENLQPIRHAGATDDERLRVLFVALTRARAGLHLSSATLNYNGKPAKRLKFLDEHEDSDGQIRSHVLPEAYSAVQNIDSAAPELGLLEIDWRARHISGLTDTDLHGLLADRLVKYQLSPTHLTDFINLEYAGPQQFFLKSLLKFPEAPSPDAQFGTAIHDTLEWAQHRTTERGSAPTTLEVINYFKIRMVSKRLGKTRTSLELERGEKTLTAWMRQRAHILKPQDVAEKSFYNEGVFVGEVHMSGRIDHLEIDKSSKTITVVDYKTGKTYDKWISDAKLHRYRLQLYCYKLLIEGSRTYKEYTVPAGRLEFIEPDDNGKIKNLELKFNDEELNDVKQLLAALWRHVHGLNFPDVSAYPASLAGMKAFEQALIAGEI